MVKIQTEGSSHAVQDSQQAIGILGGTFDPVHDGHLIIAEHVLHAFKLLRIEFLPCYQPPHRNLPQASPKARLAMVKLAIQDFPQFDVNDMEIVRKGISYTIDTLTTLRRKIPNQPFCFILGADAFTQFSQWHQWKSLLSLTHLIVISREEIEFAKKSEWMQALLRKHQVSSRQALHQRKAGNIYIEFITPILISATKIRQQIQTKQEVLIGLPNAVKTYIEKYHIYE